MIARTRSSEDGVSRAGRPFGCRSLTAWIATAMLVCCGCSGSGTQALSGSVTLDGQPLATGQIEFEPAAETGGPVVGATINEGAYEVPAVAQGLKVGGKYSVRITSLQGRGVIVIDPNSPNRKSEALENIIPKRYNETTELNVTIEPGETVRDFALQSGAPQQAALAR